MFSGTLGRSQFFVRSCLAGIAEAVLLLICIAAQYEALLGPPGPGRYRLAATTFVVSAFFAFLRTRFAIRRNRDAGGGELFVGIYAIGICMTFAMQIQALIATPTFDNPMNGMGYAGLLYLLLTGMWLYLLFASPAPGAAQPGTASDSARDSSDSRANAAASAQLSLAMEQAIAGRKPIPTMPVPAQPQGFLGTARQIPATRQRTEFGRRGLK